MTNALGRADVGCVLSIAGHSDRVDTAGVDRNAARNQELEGSKARAELTELLGRKVHLFLHVKVKANWDEDRSIYRDMGLDWVD